MNYIIVINNLLNKWNNDIDMSLYEFITTYRISKEEIEILKREYENDKIIILFLNRLIRYVDDNLFITEYILSDSIYTSEFIKEKYKYFYDNNRLYPYGIDMIRKMIRKLSQDNINKLTKYVDGYTIYYKERKKEEKVKINRF